MIASGENIIAAAIGALAGNGGLKVLARFTTPERNRTIATYYREVITGLEAEGKKLRKRLSDLEDEQAELRELMMSIARGEGPAELS